MLFGIQGTTRHGGVISTCASRIYDEVDPESWTGRIVKSQRGKNDPCQKAEAPMVRKLPVNLFLLLWAATVSVAAEIKVATLNCFLLFDPRIEHRGKLDDEQRMSVAQYNEKLGNSLSMSRLSLLMKPRTPASVSRQQHPRRCPASHG